MVNLGNLSHEGIVTKTIKVYNNWKVMTTKATRKRILLVQLTWSRRKMRSCLKSMANAGLSMNLLLQPLKTTCKQ